MSDRLRPCAGLPRRGRLESDVGSGDRAAGRCVARRQWLWQATASAPRRQKKTEELEVDLGNNTESGEEAAGHLSQPGEKPPGKEESSDESGEAKPDSGVKSDEVEPSDSSESSTEEKG